MDKRNSDKLSRAETRRKRQIFNYYIKIAVVAVIILVLVLSSLGKSEDAYVCYNENSNVDYKVYLKENDFYKKDYLGKDKEYIASLIDYITAEFNYNLSIFEKDIEYDYSYRIEADVNVEEKRTGKSIYSLKEELVKKKDIAGTSNVDVNINEKIEIDYNKYNNLISKFVRVYDLDNVESNLKINMYINVDGKCDKIERDVTDEYVVSLNIPLTTKTVAIDIDSDLIGCEQDLMSCKSEKKSPILPILTVIAIGIEIIFIVKVLKALRTNESIYKLEQKRILSCYGEYIQKVTNPFDLTGYQVLFLDKFEDMLKIRDTIQEPILMIENEEKDETCFVIPSNTKILYLYDLKMSEMKK